MRRIVVTGLGLVSPLGCGSELAWSRLLSARSGLAALPEWAAVLPARVAGIVPTKANDADGGEAIERANDTEYGLAAYIYTRDLARGMRVAAKIETGMIALNRGLMSDPAAPFGGVKQSGIGREGGQGHGIAEFMEAKYLAVTM